MNKKINDLVNLVNNGPRTSIIKKIKCPLMYTYEVAHSTYSFKSKDANLEFRLWMILEAVRNAIKNIMI